MNCQLPQRNVRVVHFNSFFFVLGLCSFKIWLSCLLSDDFFHSAFLSSFRFIAKSSGRYGEFLYTSCLFCTPTTHLLSTSCTTVVHLLNSESILIHYHHPSLYTQLVSCVGLLSRFYSCLVSFHFLYSAEYNSVYWKASLTIF